MKPIKKILSIILILIISLIIGFIIGYRTTVCSGAISIDKENAHIGYFECFGQVDEYYID